MSERDKNVPPKAQIVAEDAEEALRSEPALPGEGEASPPAAAAAAESTGDGDALGAEVAALRGRLEEATATARELRGRLEAEHERLLRLAAELENYKKRAARERDDVQRFGNERLLKDLLPVMDGLDRALAAASSDDALAQGVRLVRASLEQALAKHGVTAFSALGEPFDPALHEALVQIPTAGDPPGTVVLEHARGFKLHDRLVRPAMVGVAVVPPTPEGVDTSTG